jgi:hypothetical protein
MSFPYCGNYLIQCDLYIIDETDQVWHYIAEKHQTIQVKVEEDPVRQKLFAAYAAANAASNATPAQQQ